MKSVLGNNWEQLLSQGTVLAISGECYEFHRVGICRKATLPASAIQDVLTSCEACEPDPCYCDGEHAFAPQDGVVGGFHDGTYGNLGSLSGAFLYQGDNRWRITFGDGIDAWFEFACLDGQWVGILHYDGESFIAPTFGACCQINWAPGGGITAHVSFTAVTFGEGDPSDWTFDIELEPC